MLLVFFLPAMFSSIVGWLKNCKILMRKGRKKEVKLRGGRFNEGDKKGRRRGEKRTWGEEETAERGQTIIALQ